MCELIGDAMAHDEDMLNISRSTGGGDVGALAAWDGASSASQSRISVATDASPQMLLLSPRAPVGDEGKHEQTMQDAIPILTDGIDTPAPTASEANLTTLDSQPTEEQARTPKRNSATQPTAQEQKSPLPVNERSEGESASSRRSNRSDDSGRS